MLTETDGYEWIDRQLDLLTWSDQKDDYIIWLQEKATGRIKDDLDVKMCSTKYGNLPDDMIQIEGNHFAKRRGDLLYTFECPQKLGMVRPMEDICTTKVPLENGLYMDSVTKIATKHTAVIDCNSHYPLTILSMDGWISITSTGIHAAVAPEEIKMEHHVIKHESMKTGGIYQREIVEQWENIVEYGAFHSAVQETLSYGICRKSGGPCKMAEASAKTRAPIYDLDKIKELVQEELQPWEKFDEWIKTYGSYLALLNIMLMMIQLLIAFGMIATTMLNDGLDAGIAAVYAVMCFLPHQVESIRRRAARARTVPTAPDDSAERQYLKPL